MNVSWTTYLVCTPLLHFRQAKLASTLFKPCTQFMEICRLSNDGRSPESVNGRSKPCLNLERISHAALEHLSAFARADWAVRALQYCMWKFATATPQRRPIFLWRRGELCSDGPLLPAKQYVAHMVAHTCWFVMMVAHTHRHVLPKKRAVPGNTATTATR